MAGGPVDEFIAYTAALNRVGSRTDEHLAAGGSADDQLMPEPPVENFDII
jgi:hypothetical protein